MQGGVAPAGDADRAPLKSGPSQVAQWLTPRPVRPLLAGDAQGPGRDAGGDDHARGRGRSLPR